MRLWTIGAAAKELDTTEAGIRALIRSWRIKTHKVPYSGAGKGLDESHMAILRRALGRDVVKPTRGRPRKAPR